MLMFILFLIFLVACPPLALIILVIGIAWNVFAKKK